MTDPIADMLTRIRNAIQIESPSVDIPASRVKVGLAEALQREGFIWDFEIIEQPPQNVLRINLKYGPNGERVMQRIRRVSAPGRRVYAHAKNMPSVLQGLGVCILTTNQGVLSSREAKAKNVGGEILCEVW
jgi:small subunit ribosomal protein S8